MSRTPKNHPASFKTKVAFSALREGTPISELGLKYGVHATVMHRWKREALTSNGGWVFREAQETSHRSRGAHS